MKRPARKFFFVSHLSVLFMSAGLISGAMAFAQSTPPPEQHSSLRDIFHSWLPGDDSASDQDTGESVEPADAEGGVPTVLDGSAFTPSDVLNADDLAHAVAWHAADFSDQKGALGWSQTTFDLPEAMRTRVDFWKEIYSKYTTDQGVLHDTLHVDIIYGVMDFSAISRDPLKTLYQKARAREQLIKDKKKEIMARLQHLGSLANADGLTGEDLRIWKMFEPYQTPGKFVAAAKKNRVRFQLGQRDKFILGIYYSGRYLRDMERVFREEGLPIELTRLPFVESSFNIYARSRVGASGIWQFMPRTARPYMKVNRDVDERNDPIKSTLAAARVLKQNYAMLSSWPLALTGWNHGPYGVRNIVNKMGTHDLPQIIARYSSRTFGFASENFYACFLAALDVERNARTYFGDVKWSAEVASSEVKVTNPLSYQNLLAFYDGNSQLTALLNPQFSPRLRSGHTAIPRGSYVRVPPARLSIVQDFMKGLIPTSKLVATLQTVVLPPITVSGVGAVTTRASSGTNSQVTAPSPSLQAPTPALAKLVAAPTATPTLTLSAEAPRPLAASTASALPTPAPSPVVVVGAAPPVARPTSHRVQIGDNLTKLARFYGLSMDELRKANGMLLASGRKKSTLRIGQVLEIPPLPSASASDLLPTPTPSPVPTSHSASAPSP